MTRATLLASLCFAICALVTIGVRALAADNRSDSFPATRSPGGATTTPPTLVCCYARHTKRYALRTGSCPTVWDDPVDWKKVNISLCRDPNVRPPEAPLAPTDPKHCCRYSGASVNQPIYKFETRQTCLSNKGTFVHADKCFLVLR
jgi:hypothetical protein